MSKILVRRGQRVSQGQVIGLVGSTGLATGPHVCYRFWKNGVQVDATIKITYWRTYDGSNKSRFMNKISPLKFRWTCKSITVSITIKRTYLVNTAI
jgi:murein DD-endopeptidase MepM/ murein hydrolase activator NlpD